MRIKLKFAPSVCTFLKMLPWQPRWKRMGKESWSCLKHGWSIGMNGWSDEWAVAAVAKVAPNEWRGCGGCDAHCCCQSCCHQGPMVNPYPIPRLVFETQSITFILWGLHETSKEFRMLSSVTLFCQVTMIVIFEGSLLSENFTTTQWLPFVFC